MTVNDFDDNTSDETIDTDLTSYSVDDETQLQPEDALTGSGTGEDDALDAGIVANDRPMGVDAWGTTAFEQQHRETIDQRLSQELPDEGGAYGRPTDHVEDADADLTDPDAVPAEEDWTGDAAPRAGRLVAPDEGAHEDREAALVGEDVGVDGGAASAEEAAVHVVDEGDLDLDGTGEDDLVEELAAEQAELAQEAGALGITAEDVEDFEGAADQGGLDEVR